MLNIDNIGTWTKGSLELSTAHIVPFGVEKDLQLAIEHGLAFDESETFRSAGYIRLPVRDYLRVIKQAKILLIELSEPNARVASAPRVQSSVHDEVLSFGKTQFAAGFDGQVGVFGHDHVLRRQVRSVFPFQNRILTERSRVEKRVADASLDPHEHTHHQHAQNGPDLQNRPISHSNRLTVRLSFSYIKYLFIEKIINKNVSVCNNKMIIKWM